MRIVIGCDCAAVALKEELVRFMAQRGIETVDVGVGSDADQEPYPDVAERVALAIARSEFERGILLCGTGIGMAITANKVPGVRAACCHDVYSAERARKSNDAQVITMGARVIGPELAKTVLNAWLESEFGGGGSASKVQRIKDIEGKYLADDKV